MLRILFLFLVLLSGQLQVRAQQAADDIAARIIVIGDPGKLHDGKNLVTDAVRQYVSAHDNKTTIVFAGDNIYPKGLPDEEDKDYITQANVLRTLLLSFKNYEARVFVVPGNHDWQKSGPGGWDAIKRQDQFVQSLKLPNTKFLPSGGCPGPEEIPLSDSVVLIIMDTQWWLHPGEKPGENSDCDCKTEDQVLARLHDIAFRNRNKRMLFVAHHPLRSHGEHGGYYTWKQHLFPFTDLNKHAYIPLPVLGSIYPFVRGTFGNVEDLPHPVYKDMVHGIEAAFNGIPDISYVGGHEHNLQFMREGNRNYIVSGSGTNRDRVTTGKNTLFASDANGFVEIIYTKNGKQTVRFYSVDANGIRALAYSYDVPYISLQEIVPTAAVEEMLADSITLAIAPEYDHPGSVHRLFFGEHYRKVWATPVKMSVFHIRSEKGGLKILRKGGGQQTLSLRMEDKLGKQWVLRTIQKNPEKALPANLKATIAKPIVQDQISASNPFAAVTIPELATAAGVPHSEPRIVYIPDDTALGIYRSEFAHSVCLFEEREPGGEDTYSTQKVLEKLEEDNDNSVDQKAVLRARMLDLLIGDWDRHEDQWRWLKENKGKKNIYRPVPRDRDQAYFISTGILPYIAGRSWIMPKFQGFSAKISNVNGFMYNARYFDRLFLSELEQKDWEEVISTLQKSVTDRVIDAAIRQMPDTIYQSIGPKIKHDLIVRRDHLLQYGLKYYRFISRSVDIPASDKKELITAHNDVRGNTSVTVQKLKKDGSPGDTIYERTLNKKITREIRVYGRGGADAFVVEGEHKPHIKLRMIGGGGADSFVVSTKTRSKGRILIYDRSDKDNIFPEKGAGLRLSDNNSVNEYNPQAFKYDKLAPLATAGFNLDDGLLLGIGAVYTRQGFRREPFAARHRLMVGRSLATNAAFSRYKGDITHVIGNAALDMYLNVHAPDNTSNFFGIGNETGYQKITDPDIRYYRTRYNFIDAQAKLKWPVGKHMNVFAGVAGQYFNMNVSDNTGRFISLYENQHRDQNLFDHKFFAGAVTGYEIDTRNDKLMPLRGFHWQSSLTAMQQLDHQHNYAQLQTEMSVYISFSRYPRMVIADRFGAGHSLGTPSFFQMFYLGGDKALLGFRKNRFAGSSICYNNLELRLKLFDFASYIFPGTLGLVGFNDLGRVWASDQASAKWHMGYGSGLYLIPAESVVINAVAGISDEGVLPYISLGFRF